MLSLRFIPALAVLAFIAAFSADTLAHSVGLSRGEYVVSQRALESRIIVSQDELRDAVPGLDVNGDGRLEAHELPAGVLSKSAIVKGIELEVGGADCPARMKSAAPVEGDGIAVTVRHDCEPARGELVLNLRFIDRLSAGHRHVAELRSNDNVQNVVAYRGNTSFHLDASSSAHREPSTPPAWQYFRLGVEHILFGFDHLLFLLGLVAAAQGFRALLVSVTAFTLAHSVTLCLSAVGAVSMSPQWVEPLIAASIAYVGLANLLSKNVSTRWPLTFCFGLIHGLGFAGALRDIGLPADGIVFPLALFNAGIELGQLLALAAVVPVFHWVRQRTRFGVPAARALNGALVAAGIFWCAVRLVPAVRAATNSEKPAAKTQTSAPGMTTVPSPAPAAGLDEEPPSHRSVYPSTSEPAPADVERLCRTFHELPRTRRAECGAATPGFVLTRECVRTLGAAVRSSAVRVARTQLDHCLDEWVRRYEGCAWVERASLPPVSACQSLLQGTLREGASCRSSLECEPNLYCHGVGPMDMGVCGKPHKAGAACGLATDTLMAYASAAAAPRRECEGECVTYRCQAKGSSRD